MAKRVINEDAVISSLTKRLVGEQKMSLAGRKREMLSLRKRIKKLETAIASLYEAYVTEHAAPHKPP